MTDEEMAEQFADNISGLELTCSLLSAKDKSHAYRLGRYDGFLAGLKAGRPQWHKITDWKDNSQFPNDEIKTYLVRLYQDHYIICEMEITEGYRQFYLQDNLAAIDPQDVIAWCEIPTFDKE